MNDEPKVVTDPDGSQYEQLDMSPPPENCGHCWHKTGRMRLVYPPQVQKRCCFCGKTRWVSVGAEIKVAGHGPYQGMD